MRVGFCSQHACAVEQLAVDVERLSVFIFIFVKEKNCG